MPKMQMTNDILYRVVFITKSTSIKCYISTFKLNWKSESSNDEMNEEEGELQEEEEEEEEEE